MTTSRVAQLAWFVAIAAAALVVGAPLLVQLGALPGFTGFRLFGLGALVALAALVLGLLALYTTRPSTGRAGRRRALVATLGGAAIVGAVLAIALPRLDRPVINDVTTDPADPPVYRELAVQPANAGRDMGYPPDFAAVQTAGYPDLAPIELALPPAEAHSRTLAAMREIGFSVVRSDPAAGELEATATSRIFRFTDDIAVRIRPSPGGSRIDVRSKSRDGRGDLGANAARIGHLRAALE